MEAMLRRIDLECYITLFASNCITLALLFKFGDKDLESLGVKIYGHRYLILHEVSKLSECSLAYDHFFMEPRQNIFVYVNAVK